MEDNEHAHHAAKNDKVYVIKKERVWQGIAAVLGIVIIVMFFGKFGGSNQAAPAQAQVPTQQQPQDSGEQLRLTIDEDDDPTLGDKNAPVTIVSFEDYQCPFCGRAFQQTFPLIKKDYIDTGKVKYIYRDFPLSFHPEAEPAAEAANCAGEQGKYWEMHDSIFQNQDSMGNAAYKQFAQKIGLDTKKFNECLDSSKYKQEILDDFNYGSQVGVSGTPTFFINGIKLVGAHPYESFKQIIDTELSS
ncbi:DsbA family protein [Candidatus Woesearchaeota archaeon]|nr:DsbA family protein [Candidatus Woesearchaeota archaeon]